MKKVFLAFLITIGFISFRASAQVSVNLNIGSQPSWGPAGYDYAEYYYLPDVECYYYMPKRQFIYLSNGRWNFSLSLPSRYRGYDLDHGYKVVINSRDAYYNFDNDRVRYARYKKHRGQRVIRYDDDDNYYRAKGNPHGMPPGQAKKMYSEGNWKGNGQGHGHGRGRGNEDED